MIQVSQKGKNTSDSLLRIQKLVEDKSLYKRYGEAGVEALAKATPKDTGVTASSWYYEIENTKGGVIINWLNSNVNDGVVIAVIIQMGHGTGTGGYVKGTDYINPAMKKVFEDIANSLWEEVSRS